jgi:hypothetical protein
MKMISLQPYQPSHQQDWMAACREAILFDLATALDWPEKSGADLSASQFRAALNEAFEPSQAPDPTGWMQQINEGKKFWRGWEEEEALELATWKASHYAHAGFRFVYASKLFFKITCELLKRLENFSGDENSPVWKFGVQTREAVDDSTAFQAFLTERIKEGHIHLKILSIGSQPACQLHDVVEFLSDTAEKVCTTPLRFDIICMETQHAGQRTVEAKLKGFKGITDIRFVRGPWRDTELVVGAQNDSATGVGGNRESHFRTRGVWGLLLLT